MWVLAFYCRSHFIEMSLLCLLYTLPLYILVLKWCNFYHLLSIFFINPQNHCKGRNRINNDVALMVHAHTHSLESHPYIFWLEANIQKHSCILAFSWLDQKNPLMQEHAGLLRYHMSKCWNKVKSTNIVFFFRLCLVIMDIKRILSNI